MTSITAILVLSIGFPILAAAHPLEAWIEGHIPATAYSPKAIAYGENRFVAVGDGGKVLVSGDGLHWEQRAIGTAASLNDIIFAENRFLAAGDSDEIFASTDGDRWETVFQGQGPIGYSLRGLAYGNGRFVAVGWGCVEKACAGTVVTSSDAKTWSTAAFDGNPEKVAFGNGRFVAIWYGGSWTSPDAVRWQPGTNRWDFKVSSIAFGNGVFVVGGGDGDAVLARSADGVNWEATKKGLPGIAHVVFGDGVFVALGLYAGHVAASSVIYASEDGASWTIRYVRPADDLSRLAYGNGRFIAFSDRGAVLQSGPWQSPITAPRFEPKDLTKDLTGFLFNSLRLVIETPVGAIRVEFSADLVHWQPLTNLIASVNWVEVFDPVNAEKSPRFYRAKFTATRP